MQTFIRVQYNFFLLIYKTKSKSCQEHIANKESILWLWETF